MNNAYAVIHDFGIYIKVFSQLYNHNISAVTPIANISRDVQLL